jgi:hypothetical protein
MVNSGYDIVKKMFFMVVLNGSITNTEMHPSSHSKPMVDLTK